MSSKVTHAPFKYFGGKFRIAPWIISFFPLHETYIESCGGSAAVLLRKEPSRLEVFNDLDGNVVNFFQVLRDRKEELVEKIRLTPYARDEHELCRQPDSDPLENARRFYVSSWMSISNMAFDKATGWRSVSFAGQNFLDAPILFRDAQERLWQVAERLQLVQIENRPASYVIERYDSPKSLHYFDPPYVTSTRTNPNMYTYEWEDEQHVEHAEILNKVKGYVVISGYVCPLYQEIYEDRGWVRFDKEARGNSNSKRTESIWLSPKTAAATNQAQQYSFII